MTSRAIPGLQEPSQHPVSAVSQRALQRGAVAQPQNIARAQIKQEHIADGPGEQKPIEDPLRNPRNIKFATSELKPQGEVIGQIRSQNSWYSPKGRPQFYFGEVCGSTVVDGCPAGANFKSSHGGLPALLVKSTIPFPPRPGVNDVEDKPQTDRERDAELGINVARKPNSEPPTVAQVFPQSKAVDFYPWQGNHPEDVLNESLVKTGFPNKATPTESMTARPNLVQQLRVKPCLTNLSSFFIKVLETRQANGRLTAPSTFKPPPRVTLTDTKRETWLRELANPAVALRRLSRTIPHGIRGKMLLEQCLQKNIPTARAVWLAKCVGANELRQSKRSKASLAAGAGHEQKWVKEWTAHVEQFLESTIETCGQQEWKKRIDYAIRLSSHLYSDRLLDTDHYLDWILSSIESCPTDKLPVWMLLAQIYWKDLVASRRRGSRLADSLLRHLRSLALDSGVLDPATNPLTQRLDRLIVVLLLKHRGCILLPKSWPDHAETLRALVGRIPGAAEGIKVQISRGIDNLNLRNLRLSHQRMRHSDNAASPVKNMIVTLDSIGHKFNLEHVTRRCRLLIPENPRLITLVLEWACSVYRSGDRRIYIAARLLRRLKQNGADVDPSIWAFLRNLEDSSAYDKRNAFRVVAELVRLKERSEQFSVTRYLQWLIATGGASVPVADKGTCPPHIGLIFQLPLQSLSEHALNLRQMLLQGMYAPFELEDEEGYIESRQEAALDWIHELGDGRHLINLDACPSIQDELTSVKLAVSYDIRGEVIERHLPVQISIPGLIEEQKRPAEPHLSLQEFCGIRELLERTQDFSNLADIIGVIVTSADDVVLGAVAETLDYHSLIFAAVGALLPLLNGLLKRYAYIRNERLPSRACVRAMLDFCTNVNAEPALVDFLNGDLNRIEQSTSLSVCSPASDNMDISQSTPMDSDDEIDRILASGTSMDEQIIGRVFRRITGRLADMTKKSQSLDAFVSWFPRLRAFDERTFERIVQEWLANLLAEQQMHLLSGALPVLVATSCVGLHDVLKRIDKTLGLLARHDGASTAQLACDLLGLLLPSATISKLCPISQAYRFRLMQRQFCKHSFGSLMGLVKQTIRLCCQSTQRTTSNAFSRVVPRLVDTLRPFVVSNKDFVIDAFSDASDDTPARLACIKDIFDGLVDPSGQLHLADQPTEVQVSITLEAVNDLSVPFCQLLLQHIFLMDRMLGEEGENSVEIALLDAIKAAVSKDRCGWSDMIAGLDDGMNRKIREHAEEQILSSLPLKPNLDLSTLQPNEFPDDAKLQRYLAVIEYMPIVQTAAVNGPAILPLLAKLKQIVDVLGDRTAVNTEPEIGDLLLEETFRPIDALQPWLGALLKLITAHKASFQNAKTTNSPAIVLLGFLRSLLVLPSLQPLSSMTEHIYDVIALFVDDVTEDLRSHLAKLESSQPAVDGRIAFLFGVTKSPETWLGLSTSVNTQNLPTTPTSVQPPSSITGNMQMPQSRSQTSQQRMMQHQQAQQGPPMQRQISQQQRLLQQHSPTSMYPSNHSNQQVPINQNLSNWQQNQSQPYNTLPYSQFQQQPSQQNFQQPTLLQQQFQQSQFAIRQSQPAPMQENQRILPFTYRPWEILPDPTGSSAGNDTAVSLQLFGARKVG